MKPTLAPIVLTAIGGAAVAQHEHKAKPCAGLRQRAVKALSAQRVSGRLDAPAARPASYGSHLCGFGGIFMLGKLILAASIAATASAAHAQYTAKEWPEGPMKQRFTESCGICHDINRVRIGYTPEGWLTVVHMMQHFDAPVPANE